MTAITLVAVVFGVFAVGLIILLIYKSTLTMHRDDQLFLDDASSHMHDEQTELLTRVNRLAHLAQDLGLLSTTQPTAKSHANSFATRSQFLHTFLSPIFPIFTSRADCSS